jgi:SpoVK/Ycf46/Vps4 family AAA+-type ATPase
MTPTESIERLIDAHHPCLRTVTAEESYIVDLLREVAWSRKLPLTIWSASRGLWGREGGKQTPSKLKPLEDSGNPEPALYHLLAHGVEGLVVLLDLAEHLNEPKPLRLLRDVIEMARAQGGTVVLVDHQPRAPAIIRDNSAHFEVPLPDEAELTRIVRDTVREESRRGHLHARLRPTQLRAIVRNLVGLTRQQAEQVILEVIVEDRELSPDDLNHILARKRQLLGRDGLLEFVESPVSLEEIAGFERFKRWLGQRVRAMETEAAAHGLRAPRGVMMLGVPGAGKSMSAKAVATAWKRPLLRLDPSVLYDRYVGESERHLRQALRQAEAMAPVILWVDEIEKGFASAASQSTDGGLSQRMFGSFLTWMQEHEAPVFIFATANNIDALPPELLRKGRFDEIFFVDLPERKVRRRILKLHLGRDGRDAQTFDLDHLAEVSKGYTGAEIAQAVQSALYEAVAEDVPLATEHVARTLRESPPLAVTMAEKIAKLRDWASDRCVPAD